MRIYFLFFVFCFLTVSCQIQDQVDKLEKFLNERDSGETDILKKVLEEDEEDVEFLENDVLEANDGQDNQLDDSDTPQTANQSTSSAGTADRLLGANEVVSLVRKGRYQQVVNGKIDEKNLTSRYYRGIAYYVMAQMYPSPAKKQMSYVRKAEADLKHVGIKSKDKNLQPKAILWHGITMYKYRFSEDNFSEIERAFTYIQENFSDSRYFNDSLLYSALIYAKIDDIEGAELFLLELEETDPEDKVYDADYKKWIEPIEAVDYYFDLFGLT